MNESAKTFLGCLIWFVVAVLLFKGCDWYSSNRKEKRHEAYIKKRQNDSIRKAFVADSLAHDLHYQDSVRREEERLDRWLREQEKIDRQKLVGFVLSGDSVYHTSFHVVNCIDEHFYGFMIYQRQKLRFVTKDEIEVDKLALCHECDEKEEMLYRLEDGDYINKDDIRDYVRDNVDEFEDIIRDYYDDERDDYDYREQDEDYRWHI